MTYDYDEAPYELYREAQAQRRRYLPHWCPECRGFTQPGSPCYEEPEQEQESEGEAT